MKAAGTVAASCCAAARSPSSSVKYGSPSIAWIWTGTSSVVPHTAAAGTAPLWWHPVGDFFDGRQIERFDAAAAGPSSPVPPGLPRDPAPGTYYASPALAALIHGTPASQLAGRYPGHLAGTIGDAGLPSPDSLVIVVGRTPAQLARTPNTVRVTSVNDVMQALIRAATAHGEHEKRTGEYDEQWPAWYAAYMVAEQSGAELPV